MIYCLISSYREGLLLRSTVESARQSCDVISVFEGAVESDSSREYAVTVKESGIWPGYFGSGIATCFGTWKTDAAKRTFMLRWAKSHREQHYKDIDEPQWVLWLDGDEILVWGEYLRDYCDRADRETAVGGFPLRIVEQDGSVYQSYGRIFQAEAVAEILESSYQVQLASGMVIALPNTPLCSSGGIPLNPPSHGSLGFKLDPSSEEVKKWLAMSRPPLQGEPHILHRPMLRNPARNVRRLHQDEQLFYEEGAK